MVACHKTLPLGTTMGQFNLTSRLLYGVQIGRISKRFPPTKCCMRHHYCHQGYCHPAKCHRYDGGNLRTDISFIVITAVILMSATVSMQKIEGRTARFIVIITVIILSVTSTYDSGSPRTNSLLHRHHSCHQGCCHPAECFS